MERLSILIAEDEALTRMDIREMLEAAGHLVCAEASNGIKAVELAKEHAPDLAILDVKMPGLDGIETAKVMHSLGIPVILLTAYSQTGFVNRADKVHVFAYLVKPVTEKDLLPAVRIAFARWAELQAAQVALRQSREQLESQKVLAHAKALLASRWDIDLVQAHQRLIKEAMDRRISLVAMAREVVDRFRREA